MRTSPRAMEAFQGVVIELPAPGKEKPRHGARYREFSAHLPARLPGVGSAASTAELRQWILGRRR